MEKGFTTIDSYIEQAEKVHQPALQNIRSIISKAAPEATETINYGMPTFRYNGNLIHFALFKNHIGLYPGPDAIAAYAEELSEYKTSKGAIQIPFDKPISETVLTDIVHFNLEKLKDKKAPDWKAYASQWPEEIDKIKSIVAQTILHEEFKWGTEIYTHKGKNVLSFGGFKNHFAIWFHNGVFLEDKDKVLVNASEGKTKSLRQWRFTSVDQMDEKKILQYIQEAIKTVDDGKEIKPEKPTVIEASGLLKEALEQDKKLQKSFDNLTPGKRKDYILFIEEAKQEKTKLARIEKIIPQILQGQGLHDKYKK